MNEERFIAKNKSKWKNLEDYNTRLTKKKIESLSEEDIKSFTLLYRMASHHLSYARTHFIGSKTTLYLNQLVGASHNHFYTKEKSSPEEILDYLKNGFPAQIRNRYRYTTAAFLLFVIGFLFGFILILINPEYFYYFFPAEQARSMNLTDTSSNWNDPIMSSVIMVNNIRVAFMAIAFGFLAGVGTLYVLLMNGIVMGSLTSYVMVGHSSMLQYWSLILPHGFLELAAIFISGGAGLIIGRSILIPGELRRRDSLVKGAKEAAYFVPGIVLMLIAAALIEGFITPSGISPMWKLLFSAVTALAIVIYITRRS